MIKEEERKKSLVMRYSFDDMFLINNGYFADVEVSAEWPFHDGFCFKYFQSLVKYRSIND